METDYFKIRVIHVNSISRFWKTTKLELYQDLYIQALRYLSLHRQEITAKSPKLYSYDLKNRVY